VSRVQERPGGLLASLRGIERPSAGSGGADPVSVEWTAEGRLRHAAFLGVRDDKAAKDVRREP
jgi:hypothetical protein